MTADSDEVYRRKLFLPSLVISNFATGPITVLVSLLLIDIGITFNTSVGVTGQINTLYSVSAFVSALLMGVLSLKFKHKSLLLAGLVLMCISALGCFLAPDFIVMLVCYSLGGVGFVMVTPMAFAMVGEYFPLEKRGSAIGWIVAGGALVYVIGAPVIAIMSGFGGWRFPILGFVVPVLLAALLLASLGVPSASTERDASQYGGTYLKSFKEILLNKSAVACLTCDTLRSASFVAILLYGISFIRQRFQVSTDFASIAMLGAALSYSLGSLISGSLVNRFGRKSSTVLTALISGVCTVLHFLAPFLWIVLVLLLAASWFFGMVASGANSLALEQVPGIRGTMMSVDTALVNLGSALGTVVGGLALLSFNYEGLGSALGVMGILAGLMLHLFAEDPTRA